MATTITSGGSASIGAIIADVDVKLEGSIEARFEYSWDTTVRYERNITRGKYGNARYGTWGKKAYWEKYYQLPTCKKTQRSTGTADVVTNSEGWKFWETSS
ncbi:MULTISPECIES: hypothetical protein [unclassified Streptomyces]|uniref:hypothetical protein n=1 Tax=unclassified Streptomyces TaxID=2593676 RepID=UPI0033EDCFBE